MIKRSVLALLALTAGLYAQEFRATLTGTVTDPSGAAIPNGTVKATNVATNATSETKTTSDGLYTIPLLEPGIYNVEFIANGFQTLKRDSITLAVGQKSNLTVRLTVGQMSQEITVTGQQEVIDSGDASKGLIFDPRKTQEYPLNGRQSYMLLSLTPGVIFGQEQFGASGFSGTRGWDVNNSYKFNGARQGNGNNVFMMNGTAISNEGSTWLLAPSVDAIQEFSAMTTVYDAQYGHEAGGVVNTVIKGGSSAWHGTVFDYFRNAVLDANNFGNNYAGAKKGNHQQNQFGGTFGGPIRKEKDFIFVSFEGWQEVIPFPGAGQQAVPLDIRNGQNFSKYNMSVYDPLTTHPCTAGTGAVDTEPCAGANGSAYWRNPFPGNAIPQSRISPIATKILSYLPAPNAPGQGAAGITSNYVNASNTGRYWYNAPMARWDHNFSAKNRFNALFSENHGYEYRSTSTFPKPVAQGNIDNNRTFTGLNLDDTHVLSPTAVLDVKLSFFRFVQLTPGYSDQARTISAQSIGMTNMIHAPTVPDSVIPNISIGGFTGPLFGSGSFSWQPYNRWIFTPNVSVTKGAHSLHFGFEYNYESRGQNSPGQAYGVFTFGSGLTQRATDRTINTTDQFLGIASLLLGMPTSGNIDNNTSYYISRPYYGFYLQDDWKVSKKLTVNIGLRYEFQLAYQERYDRMGSMFDINTINPKSDQILAVWKANKAAYDATNPKYPYPAPPPALYGVWRFAGKDGMPRRTHYTDFTTGAPRIGFAYRLADKTVIRGGVGTFYQSDTSTNNSQTGFSQATGYTSSFNVGGSPFPSACFNDLNGFSGGGCQSGAPTGPYSLVNPFPKGMTAAAGPADGLLANLGQGSTSLPLHYKTPRTYQYSLGIQQQLPHAMIIDVSFAGNLAQYDRDGQDLGFLQNAAGYDAQQTAMNDPTFFTRTLANPFYQILPTTVTRGSSTTIAASSLMNYYALWNGYTQADVADRNFRSDGLQIRFEKKAQSEKGGILTWVTSYTWSKQYARTCCVGQSWSYNKGAVLQLSPNGATGNLVQYDIPQGGNLRYDPDSANKYHELAVSGIWDLPLGKGRHFGGNVHGLGDKIISGWSADWILSYISGNLVGLPGGVNFCGDYVNYKDASGAVVHNEDHWYNNNTSCYANFPTNAINSQLPPRFSNVTNPAAPQLNVALTKNTKVGEKTSLQFKAESFNVSNTVIRPGPITNTFSSAGFGQLPKSQNNFPRLVQLALKLSF